MGSKVLTSMNFHWPLASKWSCRRIAIYCQVPLLSGILLDLASTSPITSFIGAGRYARESLRALPGPITRQGLCKPRRGCRAWGLSKCLYVACPSLLLNFYERRSLNLLCSRAASHSNPTPPIFDFSRGIRDIYRKHVQLLSCNVLFVFA